jgi:hypothetical protein
VTFLHLPVSSRALVRRSPLSLLYITVEVEVISSGLLLIPVSYLLRQYAIIADRHTFPI